jgi:hypothetical protein
VKVADVKDVEFVQSGFLVNAKLSHDVNLEFVLQNQQKPYNHSVDLSKGSNKLCLKHQGQFFSPWSQCFSGIYKVTPKSCYKFAEDVYTYDTASPKVLDLAATHYQVKGSITATVKNATTAPRVFVNVNKSDPAGTTGNLI